MTDYRLIAIDKRTGDRFVSCDDVWIELRSDNEHELDWNPYSVPYESGDWEFDLEPCSKEYDPPFDGAVPL